MLISVVVESECRVRNSVKFVDFYFLKAKLEFGDPTCAVSDTVPNYHQIATCHSVLSQFEWFQV